LKKIKNEKDIKELVSNLQTKISEGLALSNDEVIENASGINYPEANGLSVYFPKHDIHNSYYETIFAKNNKWLEFLELFTILY